MTSLVHDAQRGDLQAFEALVRRWQGTVCAIGLAILRDVQASEEVAQEVFLAAWQSIDKLQNPESFGPWLRQMARHKAKTHRRSQQRRHDRVEPNSDLVDLAGADLDPVLAAEQRRVVQQALDDLPDSSRDVMILFYREGRSVRQVAALLDLSEASVKKRLSRARQAMRDDVQARFEGVLRATAPGAGLTALVLAQLAPAPAAAASAAALKSGTVVLRRARNLSAGSLIVAVIGSLIGPLPGTVALIGFLAVLGWVQLRLLPGAFAPEGADPAQLRTARLGVRIGAVGWAIGACFGLAGAFGLL